MFYCEQSQDNISNYNDTLQLIGGLSKLFSDSGTPYLEYRLAENIFCKSFNALNISRSDISIDAKISDLGIGIKTFILPPKYNQSFQKIAEFNKNNSFLKNLKNKKLALELADMRNSRLSSTKSIANINEMIYHCIARVPNAFLIYDHKIDFVDLNNIRNIKESPKILSFEDGLNTYSYNFSKSTLYKLFKLEPTYTKLNISIQSNPFKLLEKLRTEYKDIESTTDLGVILLPLYSFKTGKVEAKSGLNQWNAFGRVRKSHEVYIPVPAIIHDCFPDFFPAVGISFKLKLPNNQILDCSLCQTQKKVIDGDVINKGKGLMSNPNTKLGDWLINDVLRIPDRKIITYDMLEKIGIDSVEIRKQSATEFEINFKKIGSFEEFIYPQIAKKQ